VKLVLNNGNGEFKAERRAAGRYALFLAMSWSGKRQNTKRRAFRETLHLCVFLNTFLLVAVGSEGTVVRVIDTARGFQGSHHIASHDTGPVVDQNGIKHHSPECI
jgi:hypothetical protein